MRRALVTATVMAALAMTAPLAHAGSTRIAAQIHLRSVHMMDPRNGWGWVGNQLLHTTNGGRFWTDVSPCGVPKGQIRDAYFLNGRIAWMAVSGESETSRIAVYRTTDGGAHWSAAHLAVRGSVGPFQRLNFADRRNGWLLANEGVGAGQNPYVLLHTRDGGAHWFIVARTDRPLVAPHVLPGCDCTQAITFLSARVGFATGMAFAGPKMSWLYVTRDAGRTWRQEQLSVPPSYAIIQTFAPRLFGRTGVLPVELGRGSNFSFIDVYRTTDGGNTWQPGAVVVAPAARLSIAFVDAQHGWMALGSTLYRTTDGGRDWARLRPAGFTAVVTISFVSRSTGFATVSGGIKTTHVLKTMDGGNTWRRVTTLSGSLPACMP